MIFAFDLIHWCGTTLLTTPFVERRQLLRESFVERSGYFEFAASTDFEPDTSVAVDSKIVRSSGVKKVKGKGKAKDEGERKSKGKSKGKQGKNIAKEMETDEDTSDAEEQEDDEEEGGGESDDGANDAMAAVAAERGDGDGGEDDDDTKEEMGALGSAVMQCLRDSLLVGEGLMVKSLGSPYEPARRSDHWFKAKKDYIGGLSLHDSLDLVPLGAWRGHGRKAQWLSPVLLGVYDEDTDTYQTLCKCMSGFTDAFYKDIKERWGDDTEVRGATKSQTDTSADLTPPVYFPIGEVWEVRGADITVSPNHTAAQGLCHPERGLSLRFPRFIRTRPDKRPQDATTARQIADMYRQQNHQAGAAPPGAEDLFD
jgi:DNA ligase-1